MPAPLLLLALATVVAGLAGLWFVQDGRARRAALLGSMGSGRRPGTQLHALAAVGDRLEGRLRGTVLGRRVGDRLRAAMVGLRVVDVLALALAGAVAVGVLASSVLPPVLAVLLPAVAVGLGWFALGWLQQRRLYAFVLQLPDLARLLANAASSGLALPSAVELAAEELEQPAAAELRAVVDQLRFGLPLSQALLDLAERMPSREVNVLTRTLLLQYRMGGDLVAALRSLADTLDVRRDVLREVQTLLAPSRSAGLVVGALGCGSLLLLELLRPGAISSMVTTLPGVIALVVAGCLYWLGFRVIGRATRLDV